MKQQNNKCDFRSVPYTCTRVHVNESDVDLLLILKSNKLSYLPLIKQLLCINRCHNFELFIGTIHWFATRRYRRSCLYAREKQILCTHYTN